MCLVLCRASSLNPKSKAFDRLRLDSCQISRIQGLEKCPSPEPGRFSGRLVGISAECWRPDECRLRRGLVSLHLEDNDINCVEGMAAFAA